MSVHVDGGALWRDLMTMGAIGATARGGGKCGFPDRAW